MSAQGHYAKGDKLLITDTEARDVERVLIVKVAEACDMQIGSAAYMRVYPVSRTQRDLLGFDEVTINVNRWDVERITQ